MRHIKIKYPLYLIALLQLFYLHSCKDQAVSELTVMKGKVTSSFTETGDLAAKRAKAVVMARLDYRYGYSFKVVDMIKNGSYVEEGDTLMKVDDASIRRFVISTEESLEKEMAAAEKLRVEYENSVQDLEAQLKSEEAAINLKELGLEKAMYETEQVRKIKMLEYQQARIRIDRLKRQLRMKPRLHEYDRRVQDIKIQQRESDLEASMEALGLMVITSPGKGLFQVSNNRYTYPPVQLKIGDEVRQGSMVAKIPDLTRMIVNTSINETDFTKIDVGAKVIVRLDALPGVPFSGRVSYIGKSCIDREEKKVFLVRVEIEESDLRLKPGMTVSCEFICFEGENELYVPNECLQKVNGKAYLYLDKGRSPKRVEVIHGPSNSYHTVIYGDIRPGQKLLPFEKVLQQQSI